MTDRSRTNRVTYKKHHGHDAAKFSDSALAHTCSLQYDFVDHLPLSRRVPSHTLVPFSPRRTAGRC